MALAETPVQVEPIYLALGNRILEERTRAGWTQQDLACQVKMARASIANIELGRQRVMLHTIIDFADVFNLPVSALVGHALDEHRGDDGVRQLRRELAEAVRRVAKLAGALRAVAKRAADAVEVD